MDIVKTNSKDGITFFGVMSEPAEKTKKIIIHIHGMAGSVLLNSYYPAMHESYPQDGFAFLVGENRGTGTMTEFICGNSARIIGNAMEIFEDCILDIQAWIDYAENLGYEEIWLQSHSLGCSKAAYFMFRSNPKNISGLILLSPADMIGLVHDEAGQKDFDVLYPEAVEFEKLGRGDQLLSHNLWGLERISADTFLNIFRETSKTAIFNYGNPKLGWDVVNSINVPVLAITGTKDDGIVPVMEANMAMKMLKDELKNSPRVRTVVYEGAGHSFDGYSDKIVGDVLSFTNKENINRGNEN